MRLPWLRTISSTFDLDVQKSSGGVTFIRKDRHFIAVFVSMLEPDREIYMKQVPTEEVSACKCKSTV